MLALENQVGKKYKNYLILEEFLQKDKKFVKVQCDCGEIKYVSLQYIRNKNRAPNCQSCCVWKSFKVGETVNGFIVLRYFYDKSNPKKGLTRIEVKCSCGEIRKMSSAQLKRTKRCSNCRILKLKRTGKDSITYQGTKNIPKTFYSSILNSAKKRNIDFNITIDILEDLYIKQNGRCAYTNLPIVVGNNKKETTASVDRIDNSKGYYVDNIQFVHKHINSMKLDFTEEYFFRMVSLIFKNKIIGVKNE